MVKTKCCERPSMKAQNQIRVAKAFRWRRVEAGSKPEPGALQNILYGVSAISDDNVWSVGAEQDSSGIWHTLTELWNGSVWSVIVVLSEVE